MSRRMVLGWTRTGIEVLRPTLEDHAAEFDGWTRGDHVDAARILLEHGDREDDCEVEERCRYWAKFHRGVGKAPRAVVIRGAAEISMRVMRRKR